MPVEPPDAGALHDFMKARFKKPRPSWFMRLLGEPTEWNYTIGILIEPIQRVEDGGFFRNHGIFRVYVEDSFLARPLAPGRGSFGLFSYDGQRICYLSEPDPTGLAQVLRSEGRPLNEADPEVLGSLFCEVLLDRVCHSHHVIRDPERLLSYGYEGTPVVYEVDRREFERIADEIRTPTITGDPANGWQLEFTTVFGWNHQKQELGVECFKVDDRFGIARTERRVLSKKIFARTPGLIY